MRRILMTCLTAGVLTCAGSAQQVQVNPANRTLSINASETASAIADVAVIHVGYLAFAPDEQSAYSEGSRRSNAVTHALKEAGIPDQAVASDEQALNRAVFSPDEKLSADERAAKQFSMSQSWTVRVAATSAAQVLHLAIIAGANQSGHVDWELADRDALQAQAAARALVKARTIAAKMAEGMHVQLGALVYASNQSPMSRMMLATAMASSAHVVNGQSVPQPLVLRPEEVEESATVYAIFSIE